MSKSILSDKESLVKKAGYLHIIAKDIASNMKSGNFKSLYKGQGIELSGVRDYIPGDDIRTFDWNVTARMGKPYVKVFNEERELNIFIILDISDSMFLETGKGYTKYQAAAEACAILTVASEINSCPIGCVFFDGELQFSCKPSLSKSQTMTIITYLDKIQKEKNKSKVQGSALDSAIGGAARLLKTRSLVFIFSDFRSTGWEKSLISLSHKNDVIAFRLTDDYDKQLPKIGSVIFQDIESGVKMNLPSSSDKFQKEWEKFNENNVNHWTDFCKKHGVLPILFDVNSEPLQILNSVFGKGRK